MGAAEIEAFLSYIGVQRHCSVSTQRIALNALVYLYKRYMGLDIGDLSYSLARVPRRLPVVYSRDEIAAILAQLRGTYRLQVGLMYGTGLRSAELLSLRVKDIDFGSRNIFVRGGKGNKDRTTMLPQRLVPALGRQIEHVNRLHEQDKEEGFGNVYLPDALSRKYPNAAGELTWQYLFPASKIGKDPRSGILRRHHLHASALAKQVRQAVRVQVFRSPPDRIVFVMVLPLIYWSRVMIYARSRSDWAILTLLRPKYIPMSSTGVVRVF
jgi:integrase